MISIAIFLAIVALVIPVYMQMTENRQENNFMEDMQARVFLVADMLTKTQGSPQGWNATNVTSIGLADQSGKVNLTKVRNLIKMGSNAKAYLGMQGLEFNLTFRSSSYREMTGVVQSPAAYFYFSDSDMLDRINNSGLAWDLYYAGSGSPVTDAANVYTGNAIALYSKLMGNSSLYRTIIFESPGISQAQVDTGMLREFLRNGGVLVFEGDPQLVVPGFSMHSGSDSNSTGLLKDTSYFDGQSNSQAVFSNGNNYVIAVPGDAALGTIISDPRVPGSAFAGTWNYSNGKIYYIADMNGTIGGMPLKSSENIIGMKAEISTGPLTNAFAHTRPVMFDTDLNSIGSMTLVIGR